MAEEAHLHEGHQEPEEWQSPNRAQEGCCPAHGQHTVSGADGDVVAGHGDGQDVGGGGHAGEGDAGLVEAVNQGRVSSQGEEYHHGRQRDARHTHLRKQKDRMTSSIQSWKDHDTCRHLDMQL